MVERVRMVCVGERVRMVCVVERVRMVCVVERVRVGMVSDVPLMYPQVNSAVSLLREDRVL